MNHPLLVVLGPTGSGKSELALFLAEHFPSEIVGCDSLQIYRGFDIGTAKLPVAERRAIPHHMIDIADPSEPFSAGDYSRHARKILHEIAARGHLPIVTGGTGFYLRALLDGLAAAPTGDDALRTRLELREERRPSSLHRILRRLDPPAAHRIHANDIHKVMRAIEIAIQAKRPATEVLETPRDSLKGFDILKLGLDPPRADLHAVLNQRAARMFQDGLLDEVQRLLNRGLTGTEKPFESLGYKQALTVTRGEMTIEDAIAFTQLETRQYAKRQMTWFRRENGVFWLKGFGNSPDLRQHAVASVRSWYERFPQ